MTLLQGDIVLVPFPFSDQSGSKPRPAIIISNSSVNKTPDVILAQITSQVRADDFSFLLNDKNVTKSLQLAHCEVRCHKIFTAEKNIILKKISSLKKENISELIGQVYKF